MPGLSGLISKCRLAIVVVFTTTPKRRRTRRCMARLKPLLVQGEKDPALMEKARSAERRKACARRGQVFSSAHPSSESTVYPIHPSIDDDEAESSCPVHNSQGIDIDSASDELTESCSAHFPPKKIRRTGTGKKKRDTAPPSSSSEYSSVSDSYRSKTPYLPAQGAMRAGHPEPSQLFRSQKLGQTPLSNRSSRTLPSSRQGAKRWIPPTSTAPNTVTTASFANSEPDLNRRCAVAFKLA